MGGIAYVTGQVAGDRSEDVAGQTAQVLTRIDDLLAKAGSDKSKILYAQAWLKHAVADFAVMNEVWEAWIPEDALPARATVEPNLAAENLLVENSGPGGGRLTRGLTPVYSAEPQKHDGCLNGAALLSHRSFENGFANRGSKNSDDDFEPRTDLNQPVGGLPV